MNSEVLAAFERFTEALRGVGVDTSTLVLGGVGRRWVVHFRDPDTGVVVQPWGSRLYKPTEMLSHLNFATTALKLGAPVSLSE